LKGHDEPESRRKFGCRLARRREAILEAATALLDEAGIDGATLSEIARRAGLSKANCYRYFESREAILLTIALAEADGWANELRRRLEELGDGADIDGVARAFARTTAQRTRLCMLISALSSVLERNVSGDTVAEFKRAFHTKVFAANEALCAAMPQLTSEDADAFVRFLGLAIAGAWPMANPAPNVAKVLEDEEFAAMRVDFEASLHAHAVVVLSGLLALRRG